MRCVILSIGLLALGCAAGRAEDFTGFYAGLNAGYARGGAGERAGAGTPAGSAPVRSGGGLDLPPSVRDAAAAMRRPARGRPAASDIR